MYLKIDLPRSQKGHLYSIYFQFFLINVSNIFERELALLVALRATNIWKVYPNAVNFYQIFCQRAYFKIWPEEAVFQNFAKEHISKNLARRGRFSKFCQRANFKKYYAEKDILHFSKQLWLLTNPVWQEIVISYLQTETDLNMSHYHL